MTTSNPPSSQFFPGVNFNPAFFTDDDTTSGGISQDEADTRYLIKTQADTATALESFTSGIKTNTINNVLPTDTLNILTQSEEDLHTINIGNGTTNNQTLNINSKTINIGDTSVPSVINVIS